MTTSGRLHRRRFRPRHSRLRRIGRQSALVEQAPQLSDIVFLCSRIGFSYACAWSQIEHKEAVYMHSRLRIVGLAVGVWLGIALTAGADPITFQFAGRVDQVSGTVPQSVGDLLFGTVDFDVPGTEAPPGSSSGFFQTRQNIFRLSFTHPSGGPAFEERTYHRQLFTVHVFNDFFGDLGGPLDELNVTLGTFGFPHFGFAIDLVDLSGAAFGANANLPISPSLDAFQLRTFVGNYQPSLRVVAGTFSGTITSLTGGPGPTLVPEPTSLLLMGPAAIGILWRATFKRRR